MKNCLLKRYALLRTKKGAMPSRVLLSSKEKARIVSYALDEADRIILLGICKLCL